MIVKQFLENILNELTNKPVQSVVDIVLFAFLIYSVFVFLKKNDAVRLFKYIAAFFAVAVVLTSKSHVRIRFYFGYTRCGGALSSGDEARLLENIQPARYAASFYDSIRLQRRRT